MIRQSSVIACIVFTASGCATSEPGSQGAVPVDTGPASARQTFKRAAAEQAVAALADPAARALIVDELRRRGPVALAELPGLAPVVGDNVDPTAVPEAWLLEPAGASGSADLVVAYAPAGSERSWTEIPAYTLDGAQFALDAHRAPEVAVLVIETHGRLAMRRGVADANHALRAAGVQHDAPRVASVAGEARATTKLTAIRLADDEEPWISGAAEVYAVVSSVVGDNAPDLRVVDLPYLDNDGTTYAPNQIILDWNNYAFQAANIQLFEHDDNTSYQQLVTVLVTAVGEIGSLAGYPQIQAVTEIANRIIAAMPASWFTNDDDYVDSFYTIEKTVTYNGLVGASGNATVSLQPFLLAPN